jgi:hypothetical protein
MARHLRFIYDTYLEMRRWMCLEDELKSSAILWNYFLP